MRTYRMKALVTLAAAAVALVSVAAVRADVASDRAAAILIFPRVLYSAFQIDEPPVFVHQGVDTVIQLTNTTNQLVSLHCFYVSANSICSLSGFVCDAEHFGVGCPLPQDVCLPRWMETDFRVDVTAQQPLVWKVSAGLRQGDLPLDGVVRRGPTGQSNAGTSIPPVPTDPIPMATAATFDTFSGELKCVVVDGTGRAIPRNAIKGEATLITQITSSSSEMSQQEIPAVEKYNGIGIHAIDGDSNDDGVLELGGGANEYNGCPNVLIVNHVFDNFTSMTNLQANSPLPELTEGLQMPIRSLSELTLVPCSEDLRRQIPGHTVAQFLVFNEFEQRFSTSATVDCFFRHYLSDIDTSDPTRSIFSAGVAGTTVGQTRIRGVSGGLLGVLSEFNSSSVLFLPFGGLDDANNLHFQGNRENPDFIVLP